MKDQMPTPDQLAAFNLALARLMEGGPVGRKTFPDGFPAKHSGFGGAMPKG